MIIEKISVIGLGYIGLPTAAMLAEAKTKVVGVDVVPHVVETINQGKIHILEPGLEEIVKIAVKEGYLRATLTPEPADVFIVAVPTPFFNNYEPDMTYVESAVKLIAPVLEKGNIIILESTSPVGSTEQMAGWLKNLRPDLAFPVNTDDPADVYLAYCPERVLPGKVVEELIRNDRIIGGITPKCAQLAEDVYKIFVKGKLLHTNARTAEMSKLTENSFRDVNIAFANELSMICDKLDINVWELIELANHHPRVNILQPGAGVGGHCIAVDPWFIVSKTPEQARLIKMARIVNDSKPEWIVDKVDSAVVEFLQNNPEKSVKDVTIACFGLAFKPNIDDLRESPSMAITLRLAQKYFNQVVAIEPNIRQQPVGFENINIKLVNINEGLHADILVMLVGHKNFRCIGKEMLQEKFVIDCSNCFTTSYFIGC